MSTIVGAVEMGRVTVEISIANYWDVQRALRGDIAEEVHRVRVNGIVDTGAARLVLPHQVAAELKLPTDGESTVRYADNRTARRPIVRDVWLEVCGRSSNFSAIVEPDREDALIGAIVLEELDLIVDRTRGELHPRDPERIISEIE